MYNLSNSQKMSLKAKMRISPEPTEISNNREWVHKLSLLQTLNTVEVRVAQSWPTLCDPMDYPVHGILQARILEWVAFPFSNVTSQPRDGTQVSVSLITSVASWFIQTASPSPYKDLQKSCLSWFPLPLWLHLLLFPLFTLLQPL